MISLLAPRTYESKSALLAHLDACKPHALLLGFDAEAPCAFYSFSVTSIHGQREIGVISSGLGTDVAAVLMDTGRRVVVGHDTWVTWLDVEPLTIVSSLRLGGVFFEFLPLSRDDEIVVLHELGALRANTIGTLKWSVDTDVIENSSVDSNGDLVLSVMDGPRLVVSLASGAVSR